MSDLFKLITELKQIDEQQLAVAEFIKATVRRRGIPITSNSTQCGKPNCLVCKLGFHHGIYLITTVNGRKMRVKQEELARFLLRFIPENVVNDFLNMRKQRSMLLKRICNVIRFQEQETRNIHLLLRYSPTLAQSTTFQNSQKYTIDKLAQKGSEFLSLLLDKGIDALTRRLKCSSAQGEQ